MGYNAPDIYNQPEAFGLRLLASGGYMSYDFHMGILLEDVDGSRYVAFDSGCSCAAPFEDYTEGVKDAIPVATLADVQRAADAFFGTDSWNAGEKRDFIEAVVRVW